MYFYVKSGILGGLAKNGVLLPAGYFFVFLAYFGRIGKNSIILEDGFPL